MTQRRILLALGGVTSVLAGALFGEPAAAQALNVAMPQGSACPASYHWEMAGGFAQCIHDPLPVPPPPPMTAYGFIYQVSYSTSMCGSNGSCNYTVSVDLKSKGVPGWNNRYSYLDTTGYGPLPWGYDLYPLADAWPNLSDPNSMRPPTQYFVDRGCVLATDDATAKSIVSGDVGFDISATLYAGVSPNGITLHYANFAVCPSPVY